MYLLRKIANMQHVGSLIELVEGYYSGPEAFEDFATMNGSLGLGYEAVLYAFY